MLFRSPIDFIEKNDEEYFLNRRGAKVYFDITKQPVLEIAEGSQTEMVLSCLLYTSPV